MIDWAQIKTLDDLLKIDEDELYDSSPEYDADAAFTINPALTPDERKDAEFWDQFRRGVMLVTGPPGQGKDMFSHMLAYKFKRYFSMRAVVDTRPRKLFGTYIPFDKDFLVENLDRALEMERGVPELIAIPTKRERGQSEDEFESYIEWAERENEKLRAFRPYITDEGHWMTSRGEVFIRKAVMLLNEFGSKYMYKKEPNKPISRELLKMFTIWRHLQSLVIGIGTEREDFNRDCFPKVTAEVKMFRISKRRLLFGAMIYPLRYVGATGELMVAGKPVPLVIDGEKPQDCLGGSAWKDIYNTDNAVAFEPAKSMRRKQ